MNYKRHNDSKKEGTFQVRFDNGSSRVVNSESAAQQLMQEVTFVEKVKSIATTLAEAASEAADVRDVYFDRGYGAGETQLSSTDIASTGVTTTDITAFINLATQLTNFFGNQKVTQDDWGSVINKLRTDV